MPVTLHGSHGTLEFDLATGFVVETNLDPEFGPVPYKIDTDEWRTHYPGERLRDGDEHDILDFGFWAWAPEDVPRAEYHGPSEKWREDREARIKHDARKGDHADGTVRADCPQG